MNWRDIMGIGASTPGWHDQNDQKPSHSPNFGHIGHGSPSLSALEPPPKASPSAGGGIDELLITLTLAIHATRTQPRPARATGRRTSIEDALVIVKCMDVLDALAKVASSRTELMTHARALVEQAAGSIREWNFYQAYRVLDELRRFAP
jgi:hypothetical protein